jgi:hypothetical protein
VVSFNVLLWQFVLKDDLAQLIVRQRRHGVKVLDFHEEF